MQWPGWPSEVNVRRATMRDCKNWAAAASTGVVDDNWWMEPIGVDEDEEEVEEEDVANTYPVGTIDTQQ